MFEIILNTSLSLLFFSKNVIETDAAIQRCYYKKVFWKYAANLQKNTYDKVRFQ